MLFIVADAMDVEEQNPFQENTSVQNPTEENTSVQIPDTDNHQENILSDILENAKEVSLVLYETFCFFVIFVLCLFSFGPWGTSVGIYII